MGAINQFRLIAGAIGLGIGAEILKAHLKSSLSLSLSASQLESIIHSADAIDLLSPKDQVIVRAAFAEGYNTVFKILIGFGIAQVPASVLLWQRSETQ